LYYYSVSELTRIMVNHWYETVGANVIPADTVNKKTWIGWGQYQDQPITEGQMEVWHKQKLFDSGVAVIAGKLWRGPNAGKYLIFIDCDNKKAIEEICTYGGTIIPLKTMAEQWLVEQHKDDTSKAHIYVISPIPFPKKSFDGTANAPAFEIKGLGKHGIAYCSPSKHKNGQKYEIIGTKSPKPLNELQAKQLLGHLDSICKKYGIKYLEAIKQENRAAELFRPDIKIHEGHNRHEAILRVAESLIKRNTGILPEALILELVKGWNNSHCVPPLPDTEVDKQWRCATRFMEKHIKDIPQIEVSEIKRWLNKDDIGSYITIEGRVITVEDMKQVVTTPIYECGACKVIYQEKKGKCTVKTCKSEDIRQMLNPHTLTDHRYIELELFTKDKQQEGEGEVRVWLSLFGELAEKNFQLNDCLRVEGEVLVTEASTKAVVRGQQTAFIYLRGDKVNPINDKNEEMDSITAEERQELIEWSKSHNVVQELVDKFAPHIYGQDLVKESIIYQIVGGNYEGNRNRNDIHILIVGDPSEGKTELCLFSVDIANGEYGSGEAVTRVGLGAGLSKNEVTGRYAVEAGLAVLGNNKLKGLDEIDKMPRTYLSELLTIMDKGFFKLDKIKHALFETKGPWLCTGNPKDGRYNDNESVFENIGFPPHV
jgi:hypothetical protein